MMKTVVSLLIFSILLFGLSGKSRPAFAHEEALCGDFKIVGGWVNEPPLIGQFNGIELTITRDSTGEAVNDATVNLDITVKKGAQTKPLEFAPTEESGVYSARIVPTQTGQYAVAMKGKIAEQACDKQIEIEDVEDTRVFEFPPRTENNNFDPLIIQQLRDVISSLTAQVDEAKTASDEAQELAVEASDTAEELKFAADRAYVFGMIGVGVGVAGIVIGVVALSKSREKT
ncbi:MAG: hypothetical protein ACREAQ_08225 [Nitrososphaera sp.]